MKNRDELVGLVTCCDCEHRMIVKSRKTPYYCGYRHQHIIDDREWIKCADFIYIGDNFIKKESKMGELYDVDGVPLYYSCDEEENLMSCDNCATLKEQRDELLRRCESVLQTLNHCFPEVPAADAVDFISFEKSKLHHSITKIKKSEDDTSERVFENQRAMNQCNTCVHASEGYCWFFRSEAGGTSFHKCQQHITQL